MGNIVLFDLSYNMMQLAIEIGIFFILVFIGSYLLKKVPKSHKLLDPHQYLPEDEVHNLRQVKYLILMGLCFCVVIYTFAYPSTDLYTFVIIDIIISLYIAITIDKSSIKGILLVLLLVPYGSLTFLIYRYTLVGLLDLIHVPVFIYFIKYYYDLFMDYTENNGLGIAIILLFSIVFICFLLTSFIEASNPLDALVMVSNAFTSNGYTVLGKTDPGKIISIVLVWSGFILSGVGTATLTAAILTRQFNKRFEALEEMIKNNNDED
jgi:hypothetical protein